MVVVALALFLALAIMWTALPCGERTEHASTVERAPHFADSYRAAEM